MTSDNPFISASCVGEVCRCGAPAVRKVGEEIPFDDPNPHRHNLTAYVCAQCFANLLGPLAAKQVGLSASPARGEGDAPVAWRFMLDGGWQYSAIDPRPHISGTVQPLYTHPTPSTPAGEELREICQRIADDYQTSETHHPDHVLIRKEHFDAMLAGLSSATPEGLREKVARIILGETQAVADIAADYLADHAANHIADRILAALQPQAEGKEK